jgi:V8-like Glu-specific endopeptidase
MPRIHANRDTVDDRFSVLGFTIRTESPLYEVAVATDPALFRADARTRRSRRNFFSSRAQGALRARRGEAIYLLPQDVLSNFIGQPRLYFGLATYREGTTTQPDFVQAPTEGHMYVSTSGLTERGLRRAVSALAPSSYGQVNGRDPSLEWGGDSQDATRANGGGASRPAQAPAAAAPAPATPVAAALMDYDDGFGAFPVAEEPPPAQREPEPAAPGYGGEPRLATAQEIIASFNGDLASQIEWFFGTVAFVAGVADTRQIPHSAICQVLCYNGDRHIGSATAFYIGRRLLLTNAHVVNGCTRMVIIPGKNGPGTSRAEEPYGRFTVTQWRAHERYSAGSRDFDMAIVHATQDAPNGQWLSPVEELRQSRPEGVAVCGYSARSRRDDTTGRIVNATLNPDKQHAHRGYVRDIGNDVMHYDVHELAGSSGSPVYWIERGLRPRVHVVGVNAGPRDATTNSGCRITDAKVAWIRARAAEWGESNAMEAPAEEPVNVIPGDPSRQPAMSDAQEVMLRSYDGTLESQLRLFGESIGWIAGVPSTRGFPHSAICFVADVASGPEVERGTAFFVGRNLLVTAAHVVQGKSRLGFVPGKNGQGTDAAHEPFGRFEVNSADWVQHPQYRTRGDAFDIAIIRTPGAAPGGHWFNRLEELRESRPEGVAVCGYSALSRRSGWIPALVNAINDSRKQHLHRGYVRELPGDENFTYDVQTLPGASGSPVFWVEAGSPPRVHAVGVHIAGSDDRTNLGCRFTEAKVAWLRRQATAWGQPRAFELGQASDEGGRQLQLAPPPAPQIQQPLGLDEAMAVPAVAVEIASVVAGAAMERISSNQGDISWQLDQLRGMKHPGDQAPARPAPFQDASAIRLTEWPKVTNYLGDEISAGFEIRWQYNGQSLGNVQVSNIRTNDAVGWGLSVIVRIMDDNIVYPRNQPTFAALRVRLDYTFTRSLGSDVLAHQIVHLFGNGRHNISHEWTQASTFALDAEPEQEDERLLNARIPAGADAQALEFTARSVAPTPPSAALRAAIGAASGQRRAVLEAAARELGVREEPNPAHPGQGDPTINSDREGRIVMYLRESGVSATQGHANPAYCAAFVTVMLRQAGYRGVPGSASARRLREQFEQAGRFRPVDQTRPYDPRQDFRPQPGDLYFKGRPGAETHVGIVVSVDDDGTLHTMEGNTWGAGGEAQSGVMERSIRSSHGHARANTVGFGVLL